MTKRNAKEEILKALTRELEACGFPAPAGAQEIIKSLARGKSPRRVAGLNANEQKFVTALFSTTLQPWRPIFKAVKHLNERQLDTLLARLDGLRFKLRPFIIETLERAKEVWPTKKRGPKPRLRENQRLAACSTIDTLVRNGTTTKYAIEIVAKDYKITPRLMRKIWERKGN
jgi:hypothetical protein